MRFALLRSLRQNHGLNDRQALLFKEHVLCAAQANAHGAKAAGTHGVALNEKDGSLRWSTGTEEAGYSTPIEYQSGGKTCLAIFGKRTLAGVAALTGRIELTGVGISGGPVAARDTLRPRS